MEDRAEVWRSRNEMPKFLEMGSRVLRGARATGELVGAVALGFAAPALVLLLPLKDVAAGGVRAAAWLRSR